MSPPDLPTRDRIQSIAEEMFATHGFDGVSLRALAVAAQVPLGGIAYHFGSKKGLYRAIWSHWMDRTQDHHAVDQAFRGPSSSREEGLRRAVDAFFAGPRAILGEEGGQGFIAIMIHEAHDPRQGSRGMMDEFVLPHGERAHRALRSLLPELSEESFEVGFHMTVSALRIMIEHDRSPHPLSARSSEDFDRLFSIITDFVVSGWLGLTGLDIPK